ncbi:uncharacterized protein M6B38_197760 [Iris pallida]|uniref:Uncharacterized protein n=1 Tax=Iris pallida TaxID=29817 RepID=A0AAX6EB96_IRIPA|nr:uncharacterized protein M6B38_197760 [Iris pallida]
MQPSTSNNSYTSSTKKLHIAMAGRSNSRRLSLDFIHRASSADHPTSSERAIYKHMDLRLPSHLSGQNEVVKVECECCGMAEDCTRAYVGRVKDLFCGRWMCGLCSEAVKEELCRLGLARHTMREEAVCAHMEVCRRFNRTVRTNPAMSLAGAMADILKKSSKCSSKGSDGCKVLRSYSAIPSLGE